MIRGDDELSEVMNEKEPKVIPIVGEWYLGADNYCLILYRHHKVSGGRGKQPKEENVGKSSYTAVGYYTSLKGVYSAVMSATLREAINSKSVKTIEDAIAKLGGVVERIQKIEDDIVLAMVKRGLRDV